jgi:hypothetical protein
MDDLISHTYRGADSMMDNTESDSSENLRLSEISLKYKISDYNERLSIIDVLREESVFHFKMISKVWGKFEFSAFGVAVIAIILGAWDLGIKELENGGDYNRYSLEGLLFLNDLSLILTLLSIIAWIGFVIQLFIRFPIMRENLAYMFIGMIVVQIGYIYAHASTPELSLFSSLANPGVILANAIFVFLTIFVVHRAVVETRDVHVAERHSHPDPRIVKIAWKDHSLKLWSLGLGFWMVMVNLFSWSGSNSVSLRPTSAEDTVFNFPWIYLICNMISIFLLIHIIWYPQFMLGAAGDRIQSVRAREVSGELNINSIVKIQGICPICDEETSATRHPNGEITVPCNELQCNGIGKPGTICEECDMTLPSRIECKSCNSSTTISSHFNRQDAW